MKSLGVIVARGGSKRVPRKVLRPLAGHPVIAWMVRAALNSGLEDREGGAEALASLAGAIEQFERQSMR